MKIYVRDMAEGDSNWNLEGSLDPAEYKIAERYSGPVKVDVKTSRFGHNVDAKLEIAAEGKFVCDRCLKPFKREVKENVHLFFRIVEPGEDVVFENEEDVIILREDEKDFDLSPIVAEYLSLSLPIKILCHEDCKGLCPVCGADLNIESCSCDREIIDSRWEGLKKFIQ